MGANKGKSFVAVRRNYDFLADFLAKNPDVWYKVSPDSMNGPRFSIKSALELRLGVGNVEVSGVVDVWARYLTRAN